MLKTYQVAFLLSLLVPLVHADASPSTPSQSFKSGFSSQRSSSSSTSSSPSKSGAGFGSFSRRSTSSDASAPPSRPSGSFGSFGGGSAAAPRKPDSALSQKLNKNAAEANALRTLDARRQAQADAARDTRPVPGYERSDQRGGSGQAAPSYAPPPAYPQPMPQQQPPVVVRQDSGLGHVIAGAVLANAARGAHANGSNGSPGAYPSTPGGGTMAPAPARSGGMSFFGLFFTLCLLAFVAWAVYFAWRRVRRARDAKKPNYSFERN